MNKQAKVNINNKDYYCDSEILKLIMRNQDKIEALEYNRDKAIKYIEENEFKASDGEVCYFCNMQVIKNLLSILRGEDNE